MLGRLLAAAAGTAVAVRLSRSRHPRSLHSDDRSFAALAFDPVRHASADLHPSGLVPGLRASPLTG